MAANAVADRVLESSTIFLEGLLTVPARLKEPVVALPFRR